MDHLPLKEGFSVADIGAGTGYFAIPLAHRVGSTGTVRAVDFQPDMLARFREKLSHPGVPQNIVPLHGDAARTQLPDGSSDLAFMANIWHELDDHGAVLAEVRRILRPGGALAILDWRKDLAPPPGPPTDHRIAVADVCRTLTDHGWTLQRTATVGRYAYLLIASPPER